MTTSGNKIFRDLLPNLGQNSDKHLLYTYLPAPIHTHRERSQQMKIPKTCCHSRPPFHWAEKGFFPLLFQVRWSQTHTFTAATAQPKVSTALNTNTNPYNSSILVLHYISTRSVYFLTPASVCWYPFTLPFCFMYMSPKRKLSVPCKPSDFVVIFF